MENCCQSRVRRSRHQPAVRTRVSTLLNGVKRPLTLSRDGGDRSYFSLLLAFGQEEPWLKLTNELNKRFFLKFKPN